MWHGVAWQERKDLAATLKDTRSVVGRLEFLIAFVVHIAFIFFYLLIFQVGRLPHHANLCKLSTTKSHV